jgi:hypothetical protein
MNTTNKSTKSKRKPTKRNSKAEGKIGPSRANLIARTMNSWDDKIARQTAILNFSFELHKEGPSGPKRTKCKTDKDFAKDYFAFVGGFYKEGDPQQGENPPLPAIPTKTEFRVFENKKEETDWLVTIVLPAPDKPFPDPFIPTNVWRCTWVPY